MNVYDFDKTIYPRDSTKDFYFFCLRKKPSLIFYICKQIWGFLGYVLKIYSKTQFKELFFAFLAGIPDIDAYVREFWEQRGDSFGMEQWYMDRKRPDDVVISASPDFLLRPVCESIDIQYLIASEVDKKSGKFSSPNNYGAEKETRFRAFFKTEVIENFYSDSLSDQPMADISMNNFIVRNGKAIPWAEYKSSNVRK